MSSIQSRVNRHARGRNMWAINKEKIQSKLTQSHSQYAGLAGLVHFAFVLLLHPKLSSEMGQSPLVHENICVFTHKGTRLSDVPAWSRPRWPGRHTSHTKHTLSVLLLVQRYFSCFRTWLWLLSFLLLYFSSHGYAFGSRGKLSNVILPDYVIWKSPLISWNSSLTFNHTLSFPFTALITVFLWISLLCSSTTCEDFCSF